MRAVRRCLVIVRVLTCSRARVLFHAPAQSLAKMGVTGAASSNLAKLQQAVSVLGKLTLVEKDLKELIKMGADKALYAAFEAAVKLPAGEVSPSVVLRAAFCSLTFLLRT